MYNNTFKINGTDYSAYVHKRGPQMTYTPIKGLPDKMTLDGTMHTDIIGYKRGVSVPFNPMTADTMTAIISAYTSGLLFLTVLDRKTNADATFLAEPGTLVSDPALVKGGAVAMYQIGNLTFKEV